MISKLKHKIFVGVLLLAILLAASVSMVIYQFRILNHTVNAILENNYKTIQACQQMLEALERTDSGILLLSLDSQGEGKLIMFRADSLFRASLKVAANNLTEPNEGSYVTAIDLSYSEYKEKLKASVENPVFQSKLQWYSEYVNPDFIKTKESVRALMVLNQENMYKEAHLIKEQSHRAIMPGIVAIVAVIVFAFLFSFFLSQSLVGPLQKLIEATKNFKPNMTVFATSIKSDDEFNELKEGIQTMVTRINRFHEKSEKV